jgi:hypothetical protein
MTQKEPSAKQSGWYRLFAGLGMTLWLLAAVAILREDGLGLPAQGIFLAVTLFFAFRFGLALFGFDWPPWSRKSE